MYPFNSYIIPYFDDFVGANFACQESTIQFLCKHGIDFNKWFYEGVNYISLEREKRLNELNLKKRVRQEIQASERENLSEFKILMLKDWSAISDMISEVSSDSSQTREVKINIAYMRPAIYKTLEEYITREYPDIYFTFTYDSEHLPKRKTLSIKAHSTEEAAELKREETDKPPNKPLPITIELGGFRRVLELISNREIPLVVHSGFMDSLFLYKTFVGELPLRQEEFKQKFKHFFPYVYDTKVLLKAQADANPQIKQSLRLKESFERALLYQHMDPISTIDSEKFNYSLTADRIRGSLFHEAGYDSMVTGFTFSKLPNFTDLLQNKTNNFINKLYLHKMESLFDMDADQSKSKLRRPFTATLLSKSMKVSLRHKERKYGGGLGEKLRETLRIRTCASCSQP